jgi:glycosyltransferase involved in cell wall biosynthesis
MSAAILAGGPAAGRANVHAFVDTSPPLPPTVNELARLAEDAVRGFRERHPGLELKPVVAVIPALNEEDAIPEVLRAIAPESCGLAVDTIVVDDGSRDRTSEVSEALGAYTARVERPTGQGSALRVGYRIAREFGARYIVTLDADGQWDPGDIPAVLGPVVAGEADFALGSRVLGSSESGLSVRRVGVSVFAGLVWLLTRVKVTDTSSGLRAMRVEVATEVPQYEPQYQSSELLVGAICHGYRVIERPTNMHKRTAGESRKGNDALYGLRYARVVLRTWWRERGAARRRLRAPAEAEPTAGAR